MKLSANSRMRAAAAAANYAAPPQPQVPPLSKAERRARNRERCEMVRVMLVERFPAVFSQPRPLKIGIYEHLRTALGDQLSSTHLHHFLYFWTHTPTYRAALARGDRRIDLAGQDAGPAAPEREEDTRSLSEYSLDDRLKA